MIAQRHDGRLLTYRILTTPAASLAAFLVAARRRPRAIRQRGQPGPPGLGGKAASSRFQLVGTVTWLSQRTARSK